MRALWTRLKPDKSRSRKKIFIVRVKNENRDKSPFLQFVFLLLFSAKTSNRKNDARDHNKYYTNGK